MKTIVNPLPRQNFSEVELHRGTSPTGSTPVGRDIPSSICLLLVGDNVRLGHALKLGLEREGIQVVFASCRASTLVLLESRTFDVILIDLDMPEIDGLGLYEKLTLTMKKRMVLSTGSLQEIQIPDGVPLLMKPMNIPNLQDVVRQVDAR